MNSGSQMLRCPPRIAGHKTSLSAGTETIDERFARGSGRWWRFALEQQPSGARRATSLRHDAAPICRDEVLSSMAESDGIRGLGDSREILDGRPSPSSRRPGRRQRACQWRRSDVGIACMGRRSVAAELDCERDTVMGITVSASADR